jgi:hypothetical protein
MWDSTMTNREIELLEETVQLTGAELDELFRSQGDHLDTRERATLATIGSIVDAPSVR